jgi:hypothetical protein
MVHARDVRRPYARGRAAHAPPARVAQLDHPRASKQDDRAPVREPRDLARRADGRRQLADAGRPAAGEAGGDERDRARCAPATRGRTEREASA